ncbi:MAG: hypothetical protein ACJAYE_003277 [Candidatus Azotimanducaceae bacterium]
MLLVRVFTSPAFLLSLLISIQVLGNDARAAEADSALNARLVWSTVVALDNANRTGNYSVLHAPGFQANNSVGSLYDTFREFREPTWAERSWSNRLTAYLGPLTNRGS